MIVSQAAFPEVINFLEKQPFLGFDVETTGLKWSDRLFSLAIACDDGQTFYFNFHDYGDILDFKQWLNPEWLSEFKRIFKNKLLFAHNAKFDMQMLHKEGIDFSTCTIHDTEALARVDKNNHMKYSLAACAERIGMAKIDEVEKYISDNKCYTWETFPGKKIKIKNKDFTKVPLDLIAKYAEMDALVTLRLGQHQLRQVEKINQRPEYPKITAVVENERALTHVCHKMEVKGIKIDRQYVQDSIKKEQESIKQCVLEIEQITGKPYKNGPKFLAENIKDNDSLTATGRPRFDKDAMAKIDNPLAKKILELRHHEKLLGTYYESFIYYADQDDILRANIRQGGTETGRFSYANPNLQNLPKEATEETNVRKSFIPRDGHFFVEIDYEQMEYRLMLDYAGEKEIIRQVMEGEDLHEATGRAVGISRQRAKTLNFALLYGAGVDKLAGMLGVSTEEAGDLRNVYFSRLPKVQQFINDVRVRGKQRMFVWNWMGRRLHISSPEYSYLLPNHIIQGGCADVVKKAMTSLNRIPLLQVHDALLYEFKIGTPVDVITAIKTIMENAYIPRNGMQLTASVSHSFKSYGEMVKGVPIIPS